VTLIRDTLMFRDVTLAKCIRYHRNSFEHNLRNILLYCIDFWSRSIISVRKYVGSVLVYQWFPKWAVPPPGGRWDYRGGR
jgi:hypothetical protein